MVDMPQSDSLPPNTHIQDDPPLTGRVDRSQETYRPSPYPPRRTPPSGDVSPDGKRPWPRPAKTSRVLVWGGAAVTAAALTAGSVLALRKIAELIASEDDDHDIDRRKAEGAEHRVQERAGEFRSRAPAFAAMNRRERSAMRERAAARVREVDAWREALRREAQGSRGSQAEDHRPKQRRRPQKVGLLEEFETAAQRVTHSIETVFSTLSSAMDGFRSVTAQADAVVREFTTTADEIRGLLNRDAAAGSMKARPSARRDPYRQARRSDMVDLRDDATGGVSRSGPDAGSEPHGSGRIDTVEEARVHRL